MFLRFCDFVSSNLWLIEKRAHFFLAAWQGAGGHGTVSWAALGGAGSGHGHGHVPPRRLLGFWMCERDFAAFPWRNRRGTQPRGCSLGGAGDVWWGSYSTPCSPTDGTKWCLRFSRFGEQARTQHLEIPSRPIFPGSDVDIWFLSVLKTGLHWA